jgi:hypothetical protein
LTDGNYGRVGNNFLVGKNSFRRLLLHSKPYRPTSNLAHWKQARARAQCLRAHERARAHTHTPSVAIHVCTT